MGKEQGVCVWGGEGNKITITVIRGGSLLRWQMLSSQRNSLDSKSTQTDPA